MRLELIDSNGTLPMWAADKEFACTYDFYRFLQKSLPPHLKDIPKAHPLQGAPLEELDRLPREVTTRWPAAELDGLIADPGALAAYPINHEVRPSPFAGGSQTTLHDFLNNKLEH